jgi:signal transduction histidine kinase
MQSFAEIFRRNRTVIALFTVLVIMPSVFLGYLGFRAVRSDDVNQQVQQRNRQREIALALNGELKEWLFSERDGAASEALIRFKLEGDRIVFPDFQLSIRQEMQRNPAPVDSPRAGLLAIPDVREVEQVYYPRIQFFLREFKLGQNLGAQYFRRLNAMIVQIPGTPNGYILKSPKLTTFSKLKLDEMTASESFRGVLQIDEPGEPALGGEDVVSLNDFIFLHVAFRPKDVDGPRLRRNILLYSTVLLTVITLLGGLFLYRAVSYEVAMAQLRADFVAAVSHEFRTPLSSMLALLERVESGRVIDPDMLGRYHQTLRQEARRLGMLVDKVLDFAQLEAGKKHLSFERVDLDEIIDEAISGLHKSSFATQVEHSPSGNGMQAHTLADRTAIIHCVQNLIENAIKYSPPGASVFVRSGRQEDGASFVEVIDDGIGIPVCDQKKIFEKFYRAGNARTLNVHGTGIGLALVKRIMDIHRGSVTVASTPGKGSRFRLVFPKREGES